jgi:hypothetical protein
MALTRLQRDVCRLLAAARRESGESYVSGGVALAVALGTTRVSRDVDIFHDTTEAVARSWDRDRGILEKVGYVVTPIRERPGFVEAVVGRGDQQLAMEWARDSAFRFFPLIADEELGLVLHPFDLATNKVLALVGRVEARDWIDVLECHDRVQRLGYLAWAACGKDPGFTPTGILEQARRSSRYTDDEISSLDFDGPAPSAADLSRRWRAALENADALISSLPAARIGQAVITTRGELFKGDAAELDRALAEGAVTFHRGRVGGAWPKVKA